MRVEFSLDKPDCAKLMLVARKAAVEDISSIGDRKRLNSLFHVKLKNRGLRLEIAFDEFQKLDLRVGKILEATHVSGSKNLIRMIVDFGTEKRQAVAGLLQWYKPEDLVNRKCAFVLNLQRRKMMGVESQCMVLAAEDKNGHVVFLEPEKDIVEGSRIH